MFHNGVIIDSGKVDQRTNERIMKPDCVFEQTTNMRLVDKSDLQLSFVECVHKSILRYKKNFFFLVVRFINTERLQPLA